MCAVPPAGNACPSGFHMTESLLSSNSRLKCRLLPNPFPARPACFSSTPPHHAAWLFSPSSRDLLPSVVIDLSVYMLPPQLHPQPSEGQRFLSDSPRHPHPPHQYSAWHTVPTRQRFVEYMCELTHSTNSDSENVKPYSTAV